MSDDEIYCGRMGSCMGSTETEQIVTEVNKAASGLDRSGRDTAAAAEQARQVQQRMRTAGFHGVATGMQDVISKLQTAQAQTGQASATAGEAVIPLRAITTEMTPQEVTTQLNIAIVKIGDCRERAVGASVHLGQAAERVAGVLHGGQPGPLISMINGARQTTMQILPILDAAKDKAGQAITQAQQAGN